MNIVSISNAALRDDLGSGKSVLRFSEQLRSFGHQLKVYGPEHYEIGSQLRRGIKFRQAVGAWRLLRTVLREFPADIVECYGDELWFAAEILRRSRPRPLLVAHTNGLELADWEHRERYDPASARGWRGVLNREVHQRLSSRFFSGVDRFLALSKEDYEFVVRNEILPREHCAFVPPGIDVPVQEGTDLSARGQRIGFMGSWIPRKGAQHFSSVTSALLKKFHTAQCDLFGVGLPADEVRANFAPDVRDRVNVHPKLSESELYLLLQRCRVFFFPTQYEGFGIALAEAMACGCAAVTTATGFGAELANSEEALIVPFDDQARSFQAVATLLTNDQLYHSIANAGRRRALSLNWAASGRAIEGLYRRWLEEWRRQNG